MNTEGQISDPNTQANLDSKDITEAKTEIYISTRIAENEMSITRKYPIFMQFLSIRNESGIVLSEVFGELDLSSGEQSSIINHLNKDVTANFEKKDVPIGQMDEQNSNFENKTWKAFRNSKNWEFYLLTGKEDENSNAFIFLENLVNFFNYLEKKLGFSEKTIQDRCQHFLEIFLLFMKGNEPDGNKVREVKTKIETLMEKAEKYKIRNNLDMENDEHKNQIANSLTSIAKEIQENAEISKKNSVSTNIIITVLLLIAGALFLMAIFGALYLQLRATSKNQISDPLASGSTLTMGLNHKSKFSSLEEKKSFERLRNFEKRFIDKQVKRRIQKIINSKSHKLNLQRAKFRKKFNLEHQILKKIHKKNLKMLKRVILERKKEKKMFRRRKLKTKRDRNKIEIYPALRKNEKHQKKHSFLSHNHFNMKPQMNQKLLKKKINTDIIRTELKQKRQNLLKSKLNPIKRKLKSKKNKKQQMKVEKTKRKKRRIQMGKLGGKELSKGLQLQEETWMKNRPRQMMDIKNKNKKEKTKENFDQIIPIVENKSVEGSGSAEFKKLLEHLDSINSVKKSDNLEEKIRSIKPKKQNRRKKKRKRKKRIM